MARRKGVKRERKGYKRNPLRDMYDKTKSNSLKQFESPVTIPMNFVMAIDVAEQKPLFVPAKLAQNETVTVPPYQNLTCRGTVLPDGDYSVIGLERIVTVELKRINDLLSYIGSERTTKTIPKLQRMRNYFWTALVVEADETNVYMANAVYNTVLTPNQIRGFFRSLHIRYGIHSYINPSRERCEYWILEHLTYVYKLLQTQEGLDLWQRKRDGIIAAKDYVPYPPPAVRGKKTGWTQQ